MRRVLLLVFVCAIGALGREMAHRRADVAAVPATAPASNAPPRAIEFLESEDRRSSVALFDNRIEARGAAVGDLGFARIYLDDVRDVRLKGASVDIHMADSVLALQFTSDQLARRVRERIADAVAAVAAR